MPAVVCDVVEQMFYGLVEPCERQQVEGLVGDRADAGPWMNVAVSFVGDVAGHLDLLLPTSLGRELATAMVGVIDPSELSTEMLDDATRELANMICGALLTRSERAAKFELLCPAIVRTPFVLPAELTDAAFFTVNDWPFIVRLVMRGGDGCDD